MKKYKIFFCLILTMCILITLVPINATEILENNLNTQNEKLLETEEIEMLNNSEESESVDSNEIENSDSRELPLDEYQEETGNLYSYYETITAAYTTGSYSSSYNSYFPSGSYSSSYNSYSSGGSYSSSYNSYSSGGSYSSSGSYYYPQDVPEYRNISGKKIWVDKGHEYKRPEFVTIELYRNDKKIDETICSEDTNWEYSFNNLPRKSSDGANYVYYVDEKEIGEYEESFSNSDNLFTNNGGLEIKFNDKCSMESVHDYLSIYYKKNKQIYWLQNFSGKNLAGKTINIPSNEFFIYWATDRSVNTYYGFSIDYIKETDNTEDTTGYINSLPNCPIIECFGENYPESSHNPYINNSSTLWHYTGSSLKNEPADGLFNIVNTYSGEDTIDIKIIKDIVYEDENGNQNILNNDSSCDKYWEKLKLNKDIYYNFDVNLQEKYSPLQFNTTIHNEDFSWIKNIQPGVYKINELSNMFFNFYNIELLNNVNGISLEKENDEYYLTISNTEIIDGVQEIKITNIIKDDRQYDEKYDIKNLFEIDK